MADGIKVRILGDDSDLQKTLTDSAKSVAKWGAAAASAAAVASVAITKSTATSAREIKNLSRLIGSSTADFQKMAAGAKTVGIEQDKLADIFKDVSDKVGDFLQTGAGPLADFFENIAPKVGVTADQFKNLSGPQAMQAYVDALEKANVSQSEMTFYMEAIASDASLLTPLLANNSSEFKRLGDEADRVGAVLSDIEIAQLEQLNDKIVQAEQAFTGITNQIATQLSPQLTALLDEFIAVGDGSIDAGEAIAGSFDGIVTAAGYAGDSIRGLTSIFDLLQVGASQTMAALLDVVGLFNDEAAIAADSARAAVKEHWDDMAETAGKPLPSDMFKKIIEENKKVSEQLAEVTAEANEIKNEAHIVQIDTELMRESEKFQKLLEIEKAYQESQKEGLDAFNENNLRTAAEYAAATEKLEEASNARKLGLASIMFGNLSTLMQTENKKLFQVGKVAALSQAVIDGYSAVLSSYKEGTKIGGPVVGAAFAATAGIATAVQISKIGSASYGGGGSTAGGMGGSSPDVPQQQAQQAQQPAQDRTVRIEGFDSGQLFTGDQLNSLAEKLVEYQDDGFRLVV